MSLAKDPAAYFVELFERAQRRLIGSEVLLAGLDAERSDFVRFNHGAVRQAGSVQQGVLSLDLIDGRAHATATIQLSGVADLDRRRLDEHLLSLRERRASTPPDPYLLYATDGASSVDVATNDLPAATDAIGSIRSAIGLQDLVGIYAAGDIYRGFANSLGQRNWFNARTFNLDWSLYLQGDKATKNQYGGFDWDDAEWNARLAWSTTQLEALGRPPVELSPGEYRTFLAPAAVQDVAAILSWGGFGLKAQRTKQTPLLRMFTDGAMFHPDVTITEDTAGGTSPRFNREGFSKPERVTLLEAGRYAESLISPRSAEEYAVQTNGASAHETPSSLSIRPGDIPADRVLERLGTGLYVGNLWYLNYSDRSACRITGMTRFATFWVQDGEITAPVSALRFDDTCFNLFGRQLEGLTDRAELVLDPTTYGQRSDESSRVPGALIHEMTFTL